MKILLLTPYPSLLEVPIVTEGDEYVVSMDEPDKWPKDVDYIISLCYNHIIREPYLSKFKDKMINIHSSVLPWNRGAYPNFWSWFDGTPKGASIHRIEKKLDGGALLAQNIIRDWPINSTLRTTYDTLLSHSIILFAACWVRIRNELIVPETLTETGSFHTVAETEKWLATLPYGWDTPVSFVEELGQKYRSEFNDKKQGTVH